MNHIGVDCNRSSIILQTYIVVLALYHTLRWLQANTSLHHLHSIIRLLYTVRKWNHKRVIFAHSIIAAKNHHHYVHYPTFWKKTASIFHISACYMEIIPMREKESGAPTHRYIPKKSCVQVFGSSNPRHMYRTGMWSKNTLFHDKTTSVSVEFSIYKRRNVICW